MKHKRGFDFKIKKEKEKEKEEEKETEREKEIEKKKKPCDTQIHKPALSETFPVRVMSTANLLSYFLCAPRHPFFSLGSAKSISAP